MPGQGEPQRSTGGVPEFDALIVAGGRESPAVGRERDPVDVLAVTVLRASGQGPTGLSRVHVPNSKGTILPGVRQAITVRGERGMINVSSMPLKRRSPGVTAPPEEIPREIAQVLLIGSR